MADIVLTAENVTVEPRALGFVVEWPIGRNKTASQWFADSEKALQYRQTLIGGNND